MIEDYYIDLYYIEKVRQPDNTGGFEYVYKVGDTFRGSAVKSGSTEQIVAGVRGEIGEAYTVTTYKNNVLEKNDIIMFVNPANEQVFLRINSNVNYTPEHSGQKNWKYVSAYTFTPDLRVVE